jgi:hypothetical protein
LTKVPGIKDKALEKLLMDNKDQLTAARQLRQFLHAREPAVPAMPGEVPAVPSCAESLPAMPAVPAVPAAPAK